MLELRSLHSLRGRNSRNVVAQVADIVFTACVYSEAIVNASEVAVVIMSRGRNDAFVNVVELFPLSK